MPLAPHGAAAHRLRRLLHGALLASALCLAGPAAQAAPAVALAGVLGAKALLVIDGETRALAPGESARGVRLVSVTKNDAVVEVGGARATLVLGGTPALVGAATPAGGGRRIVMASDSRGHFMPQGSINGQVVQFMVDTGASGIGLSQEEAERIGLRFKDGEPVQMRTANGTVQGWRTRLAQVRVGDVEIYDVEAFVTPQPMPFVLLGNSYLNRFQMTRTHDQMVLDKRY